MSPLNKVLVVDDEASVCKAMSKFLSKRGFEVVEARDGEQALVEYKVERPDVVLLDIRMPKKDGLEVLKTIHKMEPETVVIMTTAVNEVYSAVEAMKLGAYDYLVKPIDLDHLSSSLDRAREHMALKQEVERLQALHQEQLGNEEVVVASDPMKHIFELVEILGQADRATVLITGETGTGKEIVARAIHLASPRANKPLVVVNCGAIPKDLMEAELLGYSKGAFTGATKEGKKGKVELAHQGTLFLDEVGDLPASSQTVLLRILDGQPFYPVGSNREVTANVRVVAATNRNLEEAVTDGNFREDLFYRLNVAPIYLPPLRERPEEIPPLAASFLQEYNQKYGKAFEGFSEEAIQRLKSYPWRGNVRELKNAIERVVLYEDDSVVRPEHIVFLKAGKSDDKQSAFSLPEGGLDMEEIIKGLFLQALDKAKGNKSEAARLLGVSRPTFLYRLEKYGLQDK
jgi:DNA-binding NtrC family response regulator